MAMKTINDVSGQSTNIYDKINLGGLTDRTVKASQVTPKVDTTLKAQYTPTSLVNNGTASTSTDTTKTYLGGLTDRYVDSVTPEQNTILQNQYDTKSSGNVVTPTQEVVKQEEETNVNNGGNGDNGGTIPQRTTYDDLLALFNERNEESRRAALESILQNLDAVKGTYKSQIEDIVDEYSDLVDQNEVKKEQARRILRENQANRGQLDSGMGRQETLDMNIGYDSITKQLQMAQAKAINEIYNLITQAESEANSKKADINRTYNDALLEYQLSLQ